MRTSRFPFVRSLTLCFVMASSAGCVAHAHTIGLGPTGADEVVERQYYWMFGLIEFNEVNAQRMAGHVTSYSIETKYGFLDFILTPFLLPLLATSRTVTVRT